MGSTLLLLRSRLNAQQVRRMVRYGSLSTLALLYQATGRMSQALRRNRVQFLCLHHVFEDEKQDFRRLLQILGQEHCLISYSAAISRIVNGNIDRPYVALSFDDGFKNCPEAGQIMEEFGARACFFVCPSVIGETDYSKVSEFCTRRLHTAPTELMSWDDVERLLKAGHEIGAHTLTHPNLVQLPPSEIRTEIEESFEMLKKRIGDVRHFAWPLGRFFNFSPTAAQIVFATGFETCASAERGCHVAPLTTDTRELCIRRDPIIVRWPMGHSLYFLARNSRVASARSNQWPVGWLDTIVGRENSK
ncbi:MAG: hypothetical protein C0401_07330 [Anaerolinea sp.]|nr:hypothetical protein [Anaerolinea sp.]